MGRPRTERDKDGRVGKTVQSGWRTKASCALSFLLIFNLNFLRTFSFQVSVGCFQVEILFLMGIFRRHVDVCVVFLCCRVCVVVLCVLSCVCVVLFVLPFCVIVCVCVVVCVRVCRRLCVLSLWVCVCRRCRLCVCVCCHFVCVCVVVVCVCRMLWVCVLSSCMLSCVVVCVCVCSFAPCGGGAAWSVSTVPSKQKPLKITGSVVQPGTNQWADLSF